MKYVANPVIVDAYQITEVHDASTEGYKDLTLENNTIFRATPEMLSRINICGGDYVVKQSDGYIYLNPAEVFTRKYSPLECQPSGEIAVNPAAA